MQKTKQNENGKKISGKKFEWLQSIVVKARELNKFLKESITKGMDFAKGKVVLLAEKSGASAYDLKEYGILALVCIFSFFMGKATLSQMIHPFGIAAMCAFSEKKKALFSYIGVAISCITYGSSMLSSFIIYFMLYAVRAVFTESKFSEGIYPKLAESAVTGIAVGIIRIITGFESLIYSYTALISSTLLSVTFTYFFTVIFDTEQKNKTRLYEFSISCYAFIFALTVSLSGISFVGFDLQLIFACTVTLAFTSVNGFLHGAIVGFISGIACTAPGVASCLGICGVISAFLVGKSILTGIIVFISAFFVCAAYSAGFSYAGLLMPSVIVGSILFLPICGFFQNSIRICVKSGKNKQKEEYEEKNTYSKKLSEAFFSLSEIFTKLAEKQKYPTDSDVNYAVDTAFEKVCRGCALSEMCFAKRKTDFEDLKQRCYSVLNVRMLDNEDFGKQMNEKCIRLDKICEETNKIYKDISLNLAKDTRVSLISAQYSGIARLINDAEKKREAESKRDYSFENSLEKAFNDADIPFNDIQVISHREKKTKVFGVVPDKIPLNASEFKKYIYSKCGTYVTEPSFDISEKNDIVMSFEREKRLSFEYSSATSAKSGKSINGDTVNFIDGKDKYFNALICDGMGSGKEAAASSRLASIFFERLIETKTDEGIILELLNNALLSRNTESFSTVDLFSTDLLTSKCTFIKAGAAPSYILRGTKLYKIFSPTPPVGIISTFAAESTNFDVLPDDVVIMVSDGVVQNNEDSKWLGELIRFDTAKQPAILAKNILDKAKEINSEKDDMSVVVVKFKKAI